MKILDEEQFKPVPHTRDDDVRLFSNLEFKAAWDALEDEYAAVSKALKRSSNLS
jgi:hypothetical protein